MADTIVRYAGPSGLSLTLELFPAATDDLSGSYALTEAANAKGWYFATVGDALTGDHRCTIKVGANVFDNGWVTLADDTATYDVTDQPVAETSGGASVVYPVSFVGGRTSKQGLMAVFSFETHQVTLPILDKDNQPVDLSGLILTVHFETTPCHKDVAKVDGLVATGENSNELAFNLPAALTNNAGTYEMCVRDQTGKVRLKAIAEVQYAAHVSA